MKQIWTVGTLIVKDLNGRYIYRIRQTRITTLNDKTIYVAKEYFKVGIFSMAHQRVCYRLGQIMHEGDVNIVLKEYQSQVNFTMLTYPDSKVELGSDVITLLL